ncbi:AAA domain-containing protein [Actinopolyspora mzabensis]|uniref:Nuclease SbcCD subunit C n=1 Tax=Actinopolyspora mzabensis TaxID=995066 RepID=A0A1G8ZZB2_ACTMZ|nr:AAA family ATPase [Actinopolyspora mzabensis]SDK19954.1 AAA domain-containing protein [Actinopolyspora mzabensis]
MMDSDRNTELTNTVLDRAEQDPTLNDQAKMLVLAALDSDEALAEAAGNAETPPRPPSERIPSGSPSEPVGAFLEAIEVSGFRGIGATTTLDLTPTPGLTVVAGRNGCGKSSFTEALELALIGDSYRWKKNSTMWQEHWRNVHDGTRPAIRVRLAEEGVGTTTVGVDWANDAALTNRAEWAQRTGKRQESVATLGWKEPLALYRPILSYDELGGLLEAGPSELHDALAKLLGLEQLADATRRLRALVTRLEEPEKTAKAMRSTLKAELDNSTDERAAHVLEALRRRSPDLDLIQSYATDVRQPDAQLSQLRTLSNVDFPSEQAVNDAVTALRTALDDAGTALDDSLLGVDHRTALLRQALHFHHQHGDRACPVCGVGTLDAEWSTRVTAQLAEDDQRQAAAQQARANMRDRAAALRRLVTTTPPLVEPDGVELAAFDRARAAIDRWTNMPETDAALADHVTRTYPELAEAMSELTAEARDLITEREDAWAPLAARIIEWVRRAREARAQSEALTDGKNASTWLKDNTHLLRNERLQPLAIEARTIWSELRQESNVDLESISLTGNGNRRRVALNAEVDGENAGALGVMSQGELHALALALFLPRATMPESPFRFIVLDDPIQAMDPAKVDGFVQVLARLAQDRQVVVLSHDDRLPESARRTGVDARILHVTRGSGSTVDITESHHPAQRHVADARTIAHDEQLDNDVKADVLPGLCRMAVEAAARDIFLARRFSRGADRATTEDEWNRTHKTRQCVALALYDAREADLTSWQYSKSWRNRTLTICGAGTHEGLRKDPKLAVQDLSDTVNDLLRES